MELNTEIGMRVRALCECKAGGNRRIFCEALGWSPQYLNKIQNGESVGLNPVMGLLRTYPDLNARWLLFGEGAMLDAGMGAVKRHLLGLVALEPYMPVMSPDEIQQVEAGRVDWDDAAIAVWKEKLAARDAAIKRAMHP